MPLNADAFPADLVIRAIPPARLQSLESGRQLYEVREAFRYASPAFGEIEVPAGFVTDFASIPRAVWSYLSPEDPVILYPSVIHDFLYTKPPGGGAFGRAISRADADAVLREAMLASGARSTQAWVVFRSVRLFGGSHWKGGAAS